MSSLYRTLLDETGEPPSEDDLVHAEKSILYRARRLWRFDHLPALELFAHIQHFGGPTRLLDVTVNPMIAAWFAVERSQRDDTTDGRLFAFVTGDEIHLRPSWYGRHPRWHAYVSDRERTTANWGTGRARRLWSPPAFNERIAAQNAAFLLDGAPLADATGPRLNSDSPERWDIDDLRRVSAFNMRPSTPRDGDLPRDESPVFTARISPRAKREIRQQLEGRYGHGAPSLYPDLSGLATNLMRRPELLVNPYDDDQ